ncbi:MAG: hypothetical protein CME15_03155 [Gemmatimonadetes bacterium]|nr:hypothetical protein [Gemmatimonadota bacterium]
MSPVGEVPSAPVLLFCAAGAAAVTAAAAATWLVLLAARRWSILDRPNQRSSHVLPTPTLGGLGIAAGLWAGLAVLLCGQTALPPGTGWALAAVTGIFLIAALDESKRSMRVGEKLLLQILAVAVWMSVGGPRLEWITLPWLGRLELVGPWSPGITALWFVSLCNICNFMDGIDGIAATESICVGCWAAVSLVVAGSSAAGLPLVLAGASLGFLLFNVPPARIFMGDVGSFLLGGLLAVVGIVGEGEGLPLWLFAALLLCFLFDSTYTLMRRALRGENLLRAHRQHLYQRLVLHGWSHRKVNGLVLLLNTILGIGVCATLEGYAGAGVTCMAAVAAGLIACAIWIERW